VTPPSDSPSPYNFADAVRQAMRLPSRLTICDCTLREGEQAADVSLGLEDKLRIARRLADIGIHQLQAGYPGRSDVDKKTIRAIKDEKIPIAVEGVVQVFQDDWREQIDRGLESGVDVLGMIYPSSGLRLQHVQRVTPEQMLDRSVEAVEYAASQARGAVIKFAPTDTLRADFELLRRLYPAVEKAGAGRVSVADTVGGAHPQAVRHLVAEVTGMVSVPVQIHCHDDFGLATACALAGVEGGASIVDATVNGLGERAGNASLEEVVSALTILYGYDLGVALEELRPLALEVAELTGVPIPPYKSLVGEQAFAHKLDAHVVGVLIHPFVYEAIRPERVGNSRRLPLGKHSGPAAIRAWLRAKGIEADDGQVGQLVERVEALAVEQKKALSEGQLQQLIRDVTG
jgi:2-isopropylmalate synthase